MATRSKPAAEETNRRADIVRAAGRLFHAKGYSATTIRDIAGAVGMRSGSPFYHFKTKQDMLRAVVLEGLTAISTAVAVAAHSGKSPRATFEAMLRAHLGQLLGVEGRDFAATLLHESRHLDPEVQAELVELKDRYEAMWQKALKDLKRAGLIADDSQVARLFLLGALNWTVQWYRPDGSRTIEQIARQLADLVIGKPQRL
ncbi:MAG: TetR family transcriptional regulator [Rhodocyclales bacterium]|nr:TetR family transcriptional regulator [Rhodocyclales bacterium]